MTDHEQTMQIMSHRNFMTYLKDRGVRKGTGNMSDYEHAKRVFTRGGVMFTDSKLYDKLVAWAAEYVGV